jgi:hypothetical protein
MKHAGDLIEVLREAGQNVNPRLSEMAEMAKAGNFGGKSVSLHNLRYIIYYIMISRKYYNLLLYLFLKDGKRFGGLSIGGGTERGIGRRTTNDSRGRGGSIRGRGPPRGGSSFQSSSSIYSGSDYATYNSIKPNTSLSQNTAYGYSTQKSYSQGGMPQNYGGGDSYGNGYPYRGATY